MAAAAVLPAFESIPTGTPPPSRVEPALANWPTNLIGQMPNLSDWQVGDIVLVRAEPSVLGKVIVAWQDRQSSGSMPHGDPSWSHAALYAGAGLVVETTMGHGVRYAPVSHYARARDLCVRRLLRGGTPIAATDGEHIVRAACECFEQGYSYRGLLKHFLQPSRTAVREEMFCSTLVAVSVNVALGIALESKKQHRPLLPATLALHPSLKSVDVEWCRIH